MELPAAEEHTYGQILKSSVLIGGSTVLNIGIGIVRTKAMAVLLGPAGFGLMGLYGSIADLAVSIAGMGVNSSGVRQIAEAAGSGDDKRIARTVTVLRRTAVLLGILGAGLLVVFCRQVSALTFGTDEHAGAVALLSLVVLLRIVAGGQGALVQGMRRITDLAKMGVLGALFGTMISIPVVYFLREEGVVPSLVCIAAMSIVTGWWYSRKARIQPAAMTLFRSPARSGVAAQTRIRLHGKRVSGDGGCLRGQNHRGSQCWARSSGVLFSCLDSRRTVCWVRLSGHGGGLLPPAGQRRHGQSPLQPIGERTSASQPVVSRTRDYCHADFRASGNCLVLFREIH